MAFMKKPAHRIFDYEPRFYDPESDENEKRKRKLNFRSARRHVKKTKSPIIWLVVAGIILYIYLKLSGTI